MAGGSGGGEGGGVPEGAVGGSTTHSNTVEGFFPLLKRGIGGKRLMYRRAGEAA